MPKADQTLGRGGLAINFLGGACVLMAIGFTVFTATGKANSLADVVGDALVFGLIATYGYLTATTSVQVRGDDLVLVRLVAIASLPLSFVSEVDVENGLEVRTKDGTILTHIGYGSSIMGALTGNRRATRFAGHIRSYLPSESSPQGDVAGGVVRRVRPGLWLVLVFPPALAALAALVH